MLYFEILLTTRHNSCILQQVECGLAAHLSRSARVSRKWVRLDTSQIRLFNHSLSNCMLHDCILNTYIKDLWFSNANIFSNTNLTTRMVHTLWQPRDWFITTCHAGTLGEIVHQNAIRNLFSRLEKSNRSIKNRATLLDDDVVRLCWSPRVRHWSRKARRTKQEWGPVPDTDSVLELQGHLRELEQSQGSQCWSS